MRRTHLVIPGNAPTLQDRLLFRVLIKLLLPTLGSPKQRLNGNFFL